MTSLKPKFIATLRALISIYTMLILVIAVVGVSATVGTGVVPVDNAVDSVVSYASDLGTQPDDINETAVAYAAHERINQIRIERGLDQLQWEPVLSQVADKHSETMAETGVYAHEIDGKDHTDRYQAAGYDCNSYSGENIAYTFADSDVRTESAIVDYGGNETAIGEGLVRSWMNSPPHRENILRPQFQRQGIGVSATENETKVQVYATQNFC